MKSRKWMLLAGVAVALVAVIVLSPAVLAQGPANGYGFGGGTGSMGGGAFGPRHGSGPGNSGSPVGGMFRMGGPNNSLIAVAADVLAIDRADLVAQLQDGSSIADVAGDQVDEIVEAFIAPRAEHLAELVANGQLAQAEADELLAMMRTNVTERLNQPWSPQGYGPGTPSAGFMDEDGDGVCENLGTGRMGRQGGRHGRWGR